MKYSFHPYKGYLSTKFRLYSNCGTEREVIIKRNSDSSVAKKKVIQPNMVETIVFDEPGEYTIEEKGSKQCIAQISVQDGYKFGGSSFKKAFLFEKNPWIFVVMHDRTYFHNRNTHKEYVEAISPDKIEYVSPSMVIMSNDKQDVKTLYSTDEEKPVQTFSDIIYKDERVIVWRLIDDEDKTELCVTKLDNLDNIEHFADTDDYMVLAEQHILYVHNQGKVLSVSFDNISVSNEIKYSGKFLNFLDTGYIVSAPCDGKIKVKSLHDDAEYEVQYEGTLVSLNGKIFVETRQAIKKINDFCQKEIPAIAVDVKFISLELFVSSNMFVYKEYVECLAFIDGKYIVNKITHLKDAHGNVLDTLKTNDTSVYRHNQLVCLLADNNIYVVGSKYGRFLKHTNIDKVYKTPYYLVCSINNESKIELYTINGNGYLCNVGSNKDVFSYDKIEQYGILKNINTSELYILESLNSIRQIGRFVCEFIPEVLIKTSSSMVIYSGGIISDLIFTALSEKGNYGLIKENDKFFLYTSKIESGIYKKAENYTSHIILNELYDDTSYSNVLLSEDGKHIFSMTKDNCKMLDVVTGETTCFGNLSFLSHINGIRPYFRMNQYRQVRFINPLSGLEIDTEEITQYNFVSPDGNLYADSRLEDYIEYYNLIENRIITKDEYKALNDYYGYTLGLDKETMTNRRKAFCQQHLNFFKNKFEEKGWRKRSDEEWLIYLLSIDETEHFLRLFIDFRGIALIRRTSNNAIANKIRLGDPLWFINYVAFSHDSRYVAIAGRYPNNLGQVYLTGRGGLLLVYDLKEDKEVYKQTNSYAVWLSAFSKDGYFAAYSSEPMSYLGSVPKTNDAIMKVEQMSFLTFSPDGQYVVLSKQGYVPWNNGQNPSWGHQPSCLVSVRKTDSVDNEIVKYDDLSDEGIEGLSNAKSVSSVSFSKDNTKLMMVGRDGVVIVRNTQL